MSSCNTAPPPSLVQTCVSEREYRPLCDITGTNHIPNHTTTLSLETVNELLMMKDNLRVIRCLTGMKGNKSKRRQGLKRGRPTSSNTHKNTIKKILKEANPVKNGKQWLMERYKAWFPTVQSMMCNFNISLLQTAIDEALKEDYVANFLTINQSSGATGVRYSVYNVLKSCNEPFKTNRNSQVLAVAIFQGRVKCNISIETEKMCKKEKSLDHKLLCLLNVCVTYQCPVRFAVQLFEKESAFYSVKLCNAVMKLLDNNQTYHPIIDK